MKIVYALPAYTVSPVGGYHVHYEYASRLARSGHSVTIVFPRIPRGERSVRARAASLVWAMRLRRKHNPLIQSYRLDPHVKVRLLHDLSASSLPSADVLIATAWQTAEILADVPVRCGRKFYIVYDYEHLMTAGPDIAARIEATYRANFSIVATSTVVDDMVRRCGGRPLAKITCGLDLASFGVDNPPEQRPRLSVAFPVRPEAFKGTADAIAAMEQLRHVYGPSLLVSAFGSQRTELPDWVRWIDYPNQTALRAIYNGHAVFVVPSHFEGWGLPGIEAMACGAALVTTDNGGCSDYAINEVTALVVPPKAQDAIADAVTRLFEDDALRSRLARGGAAFARRFTWENAAIALETLITDQNFAVIKEQ